MGRYFLHHVANTGNWNTGKSGPQESRANQSGVTEEIMPDKQTEAAIELACDQDQVLREHFPQTARSHRKRYYHLNWKKFTSRDNWNKRKTRTTKPRQHGLCQSGKSGSSSDNIVTWDIRSQRRWLVHYGTQEQGGKLYGLFSKSYVVQHAKHNLYRCHAVHESNHAAYFLTSALALIWLTWKSEMAPPPKH